MAENQEQYAFKIFERINFRPGEEIDDLYSISIHPEIDILQEERFIQLRGVLMVTGDYQAVATDEPLYVFDEEEENVVQQVRELHDGLMSFQFPIPVDITIPAERVRADESAEIVVQYFDYELPDKSTLNVQANIRIDGIEEAPSEVYSDQVEASDFELKAFPTFDGAETASSQKHEESSTSDSNVVEASAQSSEEFEAESTSDQTEEKGRDFWKKEKKQSLGEFFGSKNVEAATSETPSTQSEETSTSTQAPEEVDASASEEESVAVTAEEATAEAETEEKPLKGLSYLSKFFRDDSGESHQITIRFVQQNETLESIAHAYETSTSHLERLNGLGDDARILPGDVIYVPKRSVN